MLLTYIWHRARILHDVNLGLVLRGNEGGGGNRHHGSASLSLGCSVFLVQSSAVANSVLTSDENHVTTAESSGATPGARPQNGACQVVVTTKFRFPEPCVSRFTT